MTGADLVLRVTDRGGRIRVADGRVQYRPPGVLSAREAAWLAEHHDEVRQALRSMSASGVGNAEPVGLRRDDDPEVGWRIAVMRPQATRGGAMPLLMARASALFRSGCCSCGEPLGPDDRYRCGACTVASIVVLEEIR